MTWNYRLVRRRLKITPGASEYSYAIHEAYYPEGSKGVPDAITEDGVTIYGETVEEAREVYRMMAEAFEQPILEYYEIARKKEDTGK